MIISIIVERNKHGFSAYAKNIKSVVGMGETFKSCIESVKDCIETLKTTNSCPEELKKKYKLSCKLV